MGAVIRTRRLFQVFAPRRSGHHAVMWWIVSQIQPPWQRLNNRRLPLVIDPVREGRKKRYDYDRSPLLNALMVNYEDADPFQLERLSRQPRQPLVRGIEAERTQYLVILRDPFNNLASKRRANPERGLEAARREVDVWKRLAREYLGITDYLPNKEVISFNDWFTSRAYRLRIAERLELDFDDDHPDAQKALKAVPGTFGVSRFDHRKYNGRAQQMDVLNRWKLLQGDPLFLRLLRDPELLALSDRIFRLPGIESLLDLIAREGPLLPEKK